MKKILIFIFLFFFIISPVFAKDKLKSVAHMNMDFSLSNIPDVVTFHIEENLEIDEDTEVINAQRALRWHKSGFILCKLNSYKSAVSDEKIDISDKNIYFTLKKHEKVYAKEATILGTEIVLSQGASFFAPGVDILYFFTRGVIKKTTHPHWFMAGVSYAYENSICWFWLKGKPIELDIDDKIEIKEINTKKVDKLNKKIDKRHKKEAEKAAKKELKQKNKELKKQEKLRKKELKEQRLIGA